jgi:hypothetical protein
MIINLGHVHGSGLVAELARRFRREGSARSLLLSIGFPDNRVPTFGSNPTEFWDAACDELSGGITTDEEPFLMLVSEAARLYQGNENFQSIRDQFAHLTDDGDAAPTQDQNSSQTGAAATPPIRTLSINIGSHISNPALYSFLHEIVHANGGNVNIDIVPENHRGIHVSGNLTRDELAEVCQGINEGARAQGIDATAVPAHFEGFRDYYLDPLYVQGPDGSRYEAACVPASMRVKDLANDVADELVDGWPRGEGDQPRPAVVDRVDKSGARTRLRDDQTLHDAGVRPHDTVVVNPERTAGSVNPQLRYEAIVNARHQILEFARATPGFMVQVNSQDTPTEYVFRFKARGYASVDPLLPIEDHEVFFQLPEDFPIRAPLAVWQHEFWHPNVHFESGLVCLGILTEDYRPALHLGVVCQMLIDMASYRTYEVHEGFNREAAEWANSFEGQAAIVECGGRPLQEMLAKHSPSHNTLELKRVKS